MLLRRRADECLSAKPDTPAGTYDARGCFASLDTSATCGDNYACSADRCVLEYELKADLGTAPPACSGPDGLDCVRATGCVFERQDAKCKCGPADCRRCRSRAGGTC